MQANYSPFRNRVHQTLVNLGYSVRRVLRAEYINNGSVILAIWESAWGTKYCRFVSPRKLSSTGYYIFEKAFSPAYRNAYLAVSTSTCHAPVATIYISSKGYWSDRFSARAGFDSAYDAACEEIRAKAASRAARQWQADQMWAA